MFPGGLVVRFNPFTDMAQVHGPWFSPWWRNGDPRSHTVRTKIKGIFIVFFRHNCTLNTDYNIV